jgi:hypothetical protein
MQDERNKGDDEFINKPRPYYGNLATIFGNSVASGQFAKTSNDPLAVDDGENVQRKGVLQHLVLSMRMTLQQHLQLNHPRRPRGKTMVLNS